MIQIEDTQKVVIGKPHSKVNKKKPKGIILEMHNIYTARSIIITIIITSSSSSRGSSSSSSINMSCNYSTQINAVD